MFALAPLAFRSVCGLRKRGRKAAIKAVRSGWARETGNDRVLMDAVTAGDPWCYAGEPEESDDNIGSPVA